MSKRSDIHDRVLNARSLDDIEAGYREWAQAYDTELVEEAGYVAPQRCAATLGAHIPDPEAPVLDAGCGTGLVGHYLAESGFARIHGLDYSQEMLDEAADKGCYEQLMRADLNAALDIPDNLYAATACVGTFTSGHVGPAALVELVRVTAPGGAICFTVRDSFWAESDFASVVHDLAQQGAADVVSSVEVPYILKEGSQCHQVLMQVC